MQSITSDLNTKSLNAILADYTQISHQSQMLKPIIGYFTNRVPVELIDAVGLVPIRVLSTGKAAQGASERYIQLFACSWLKQILDIGLSEGFSDFDGLVFSAGTCDSLQNVSDIWRKIFPNQWVYNLTFPVLTESEAAGDFLQSEFESLVQTLREEIQIEENDFTLVQSIKKFNQKRALLFRLVDLVSKRNFAYRKLAKLQLASDVLPIDSAISLIQAKSDIWRENGDLAIPDFPRLLITGGMGLDNHKLWDLPELDSIVADDLSFGYRNINFQIPEDSFLPRYCKSYLNRVPDPTAYDMDKRLISLTKLTKGHKIDGIIMLGTKWCDPEAFEFVFIQKSLKEMDIPFIQLETTPDLSNLEQLRTRISAFNEILS